MLAGNWKCNYNLGTFQCVLQSETNFCHLYDAPPANKRFRIPILIYLFYIISKISCNWIKAEEIRDVGFFVVVMVLKSIPETQ